MNNKTKIHGFFLISLLSLALIVSCMSGGFAATTSPQFTQNAEIAGFYLPVGEDGGDISLATSTGASQGTLMLYPGGIAFGARFHTNGLIIVGFSDVSDGNGKCNPAYEAGLREKDIITKINGYEVTGASQLSEELEKSAGGELTLTCRRGGRDYVAHVTPKYSEAEGRYKTGLLVRDSGAGIGTVTYIDPATLSFGGLGHGICDGDTGELIPMDRGSVLDVTVSGINKGAAGAPGEIKGYFGTNKLGTLISNTTVGVYGTLATLPESLPEKPLPVATRSELREGEAYIYCTLDEGGIPQRYSVEIGNIDLSANGNKCFTVKVTDPNLIEKTGGIVRGMSGSPIIQNGKIVGAVTHVLVNDPTTGYGIFIENMLNAAEMTSAEAA